MSVLVSIEEAARYCSLEQAQGQAQAEWEQPERTHDPVPMAAASSIPQPDLQQESQRGLARP